MTRPRAPWASRLRRRAVALCTMVLLGAVSSARVADAHPIHTTLTVITPSRTEARIMLRVFADDFSAVVAQHAGKPAPADSSAPELDALRYLSTRLTVQPSSGRPIPLVSCGMRREANLYWVCLRVPLPDRAAGVTLQNQVLTELHGDQVNVVQIARDGVRRTMLFTRQSDAARFTS